MISSYNQPEYPENKSEENAQPTIGAGDAAPALEMSRIRGWCSHNGDQQTFYRLYPGEIPPPLHNPNQGYYPLDGFGRERSR